MEGAGAATGDMIDDPVPLEGTGFIASSDNIITFGDSAEGIGQSTGFFMRLSGHNTNSSGR